MSPSKPGATPGDSGAVWAPEATLDRSPPDVSKQRWTALKLLGYDVVTTDPRIRTAPKPVATTTYSSAHGGRRRRCTAARSHSRPQVAWDIDVKR